MKHSLPHRPLRFATARAYDLSTRAPGSFWVEHSAEQFALDEPIDTRRNEAPAAPNSAIAGNPLRAEPSPVAIGAVKRFGLVGLMSVAVGTGIARWWNAFSHHSH